jgi:hypothetical protein
MPSQVLRFSFSIKNKAGGMLFREIYEDADGRWYLKQKSKEQYFSPVPGIVWCSSRCRFDSYDQLCDTYNAYLKRQGLKEYIFPSLQVMLVLGHLDASAEPIAGQCTDAKCFCSHDDLLNKGCPHERKKRLATTTPWM